MTQLQITLHLTEDARNQLDTSTDSVCLTQANSSADSTTSPVWVSFYKGCPVGINPQNDIIWTESWAADYSTKVWNQEGTQVTGSGEVSNKQLGHLSKLNSILTLGSNGSWTEKVTGGKKMMNCKNDHLSKVTFVYYFKTSVNGAAPTNTGNPIYTSVDFISSNGEESVDLIQSVYIGYKGKSVKTGTIVATSGGQEWTPIELVTTGSNPITNITADYSDMDGWSFYAGGNAEFQLTESTDTITSLTQTNSSKYAFEGGNKIITGKLGVKTAILAGVAVFVLGSIRLTVTSQNDAGTFFNFSYDGPATWATIATYLDKVVTFITKSAALARVQLKKKAQNKHNRHHHQEDNRRKSIEEKKRQQYYDDDEPRKWDQEDKRMRIDI